MDNVNNRVVTSNANLEKLNTAQIDKEHELKGLSKQKIIMIAVISGIVIGSLALSLVSFGVFGAAAAGALAIGSTAMYAFLGTGIVAGLIGTVTLTAINGVKTLDAKIKHQQSLLSILKTSIKKLKAKNLEKKDVVSGIQSDLEEAKNEINTLNKDIETAKTKRSTLAKEIEEFQAAKLEITARANVIDKESKQLVLKAKKHNMQIDALKTEVFRFNQMKAAIDKKRDEKLLNLASLMATNGKKNFLFHLPVDARDNGIYSIEKDYREKPCTVYFSKQNRMLKKLQNFFRETKQPVEEKIEKLTKQLVTALSENTKTLKEKALLSTERENPRLSNENIEHLKKSKAEKQAELKETQKRILSKEQQVRRIQKWIIIMERNLDKHAGKFRKGNQSSLGTTEAKV